jgi:hypothetical protein
VDLAAILRAVRCASRDPMALADQISGTALIAIARRCTS